MVTQAKQSVFYHPQDLNNWQKLYPAIGASGPDKLCAEAIAGFAQFSQEYSGYFEGLIGDRKFDSNKTSPKHLRAQVAYSLNNYWGPLGVVLAQRQVGFYRNLLDNKGAQQAQQYLNALNLGLPGVLIYFDKVTSIYYCPYTRIAFIGTPYLQLAQDDWLAIPHELGHYMYWNLGKDLKEVREKHDQMRAGATGRINETLRKEDFSSEEMQIVRKMLISWLEEIFCDVVGTRFGGKPFIESLQSQITSSAGTTAGLTEDDGCHPPYCLRPEVRERVYQLQQGTFAQETSAVDWDGFFEANFNIKKRNSLKLKTLPVDLKSEIKRLPKAKLITMMAAGTISKTNSPAIGLQASRILLAIRALVEYLYTQVSELCGTGLPPHTDLSDAFKQLLALAEDAATDRNPAYEILLHPRILEGGYVHGPHSAYAHRQWHTVGTHAH